MYYYYNKSYNNTLCLSNEKSNYNYEEWVGNDHVNYTGAKSIYYAQDPIYLPSNCTGMFSNMKLSSIDVNNFDTSNVTNMSKMFYNCPNLDNLEFHLGDTSNVTDMSGMFSNCPSLRNIDLSGLNTTNVTSFNSMFANCRSLQSLDLSNFDTSNCRDLGYMFYMCDLIYKLDGISSGTTPNVQSTNLMFYHLDKLNYLDLSSGETTNLSNTEGMFSHCYHLITIDLSNFDITQDLQASEMFGACVDLQKILVYKDTDGRDHLTLCTGDNMFDGCTNLPNGDGTSDHSHAYIGSKGYFDYGHDNSLGVEHSLSKRGSDDGDSQKIYVSNPSLMGDSYKVYFKEPVD